MMKNGLDGEKLKEKENALIMMNIQKEMKRYLMLNLSKIALLMIIAESLSFQLVKIMIRLMKFTAEKKNNLMKKVNYNPYLIQFIQEEE